MCEVAFPELIKEQLDQMSKKSLLFSLMPSLQERRTGLVEYMDDPDCDPGLLKNTYRNFAWSNRLLSRWRMAYKRYLLPVMRSLERPTTILDVGCGGGDVPVLLKRWAGRDNIEARITAIDPDNRAIQFAAGQWYKEHIRFLSASTGDLVKAGEQYDIVISNHLMHHLLPADLNKVLSESDQLAGSLVLFNDIERDVIAYLTFRVMAVPFSRNSFNYEDGLISIRRSFTRNELSGIIPPGWKVHSHFPYRLFLVRHKINPAVWI